MLEPLKKQQGHFLAISKHVISVPLPQLSAKPSLTADGQVSSPASVSSSSEPKSQLAQADGPASSKEDVKMEVKKQEEDDDGAESQGEGKGKMGKGQLDVKKEEKPEVRSIFRQNPELSKLLRPKGFL